MEKLQEAIRSDNVEQAHLVVEGLDLSTEMPVIHLSQSVEMARLLFENGADPYAPLGNGEKIALDEMAKHYNIREFLIEHKEKTPPVVTQFFTKRFQKIELYRSFSEYEFRHAVFRGFMPMDMSADEMVLLEHLFFRRYDNPTLEFWYGHSIDYLLSGIRHVMYQPPKELIENAAKTSQAWALILFAPEMVYKTSRRPVTNMSMFRTKRSVVLDAAPENARLLHRQSGFLPVTRYASGMSGSLFYREYNANFCGTFYYYEPESTTFLWFDKIIYFETKTKALAWFFRQIDEEKIRMAFRHRVNSSIGPERPITTETLFDYSIDELLWLVVGNHPDASQLMQTPQEFKYDFARYDKLPRHLTDLHARARAPPIIRIPKWDAVPDLPERKFYTAHIRGTYASEDPLDQWLCELARESGYEAIVLEDMAGSRGSVCEVLDTRPRDQSFQNLYYLQ